MLIEHIIESELGRPGPPCHRPTYIPTTGYFYGKAKISNEDLRWDYYLRVKYCRRQCILLSSTWAKSLTKLSPKMQDFKSVLDLNRK